MQYNYCSFFLFNFFFFLLSRRLLIWSLGNSSLQLNLQFSYSSARFFLSCLPAPLLQPAYVPQLRSKVSSLGRENWVCFVSLFITSPQPRLSQVWDGQLSSRSDAKTTSIFWKALAMVVEEECSQTSVSHWGPWALSGHLLSVQSFRNPGCLRSISLPVHLRCGALSEMCISLCRISNSEFWVMVCLHCSSSTKGYQD